MCVCVCAFFFPQVRNNTRYYTIRQNEKNVNNSLTNKNQVKFLLCIIYRPMPFFLCINLPYNFYGISIFQLAGKCARMATLNLYSWELPAIVLLRAFHTNKHLFVLLIGWPITESNERLSTFKRICDSSMTRMNKLELARVECPLVAIMPSLKEGYCILQHSHLFLFEGIKLYYALLL